MGDCCIPVHGASKVCMVLAAGRLVFAVQYKGSWMQLFIVTISCIVWKGDALLRSGLAVLIVLC